MRQLESVRALADEQLRARGEDALVRTRLAEAMRDRFRHAQALYTRTPWLHWLAPLRPEADNLRLAMAHALSHLTSCKPGDNRGPALRLAVELFSHAMLFWLRSGRKREALGWFEALAPHAATLDEPGLRAAYGLAVVQSGVFYDPDVLLAPNRNGDTSGKDDIC